MPEGRGRVALGPCALDRWEATVAAGVADPRAVTVSAAVLDPVRFTEQLNVDTNAGLVVIAPHGDDIEPYTHLQADEVVTRILRLGGRKVATWVCLGQGFDNVGARIRWHITSTDVSERSFPGLRTIMGRRFARAVAFHGHDRSSLPDVAIGGRGSRRGPGP
jgi:phage replication-related protein YjqB (UPF0714/DUF867 family)